MVQNKRSSKKLTRWSFWLFILALLWVAAYGVYSIVVWLFSIELYFVGVFVVLIALGLGAAALAGAVEEEPKE